MAGIAVVNSGNYDLKIDTGFTVDAFILDDALKGVLDNTDYVLDGTTQFASVLDSTQSISVKRGRRDVGDSFSAGTMSFTILDVAGIFNPFDQNSPYFDTNQSVPGLAPMREVELIRYDDLDQPEYLFKGYVVNYDYNFALGGLDTVTVYCADQFYLLSQTYLDELNVDPETSGERIETVLDLPEVDFPAASRDIDLGTVEPRAFERIHGAGWHKRPDLSFTDQRHRRIWPPVHGTKWLHHLSAACRCNDFRISCRFHR
jgi:hypothetical protein